LADAFALGLFLPDSGVKFEAFKEKLDAMDVHEVNAAMLLLSATAASARRMRA
jgi:hypothetical protein